jgi:hypothetical protein
VKQDMGLLKNSLKKANFVDFLFMGWYNHYNNYIGVKK